MPRQLWRGGSAKRLTAGRRQRRNFPAQQALRHPPCCCRARAVRTCGSRGRVRKAIDREAPVPLLSFPARAGVERGGRGPRLGHPASQCAPRQGVCPRRTRGRVRMECRCVFHGARWLSPLFGPSPKSPEERQEERAQQKLALALVSNSRYSPRSPPLAPLSSPAAPQLLAGFVHHRRVHRSGEQVRIAAACSNAGSHHPGAPAWQSAAALFLWVDRHHIARQQSGRDSRVTEAGKQQQHHQGEGRRPATVGAPRWPLAPRSAWRVTTPDAPAGRWCRHPGTPRPWKCTTRAPAA